MHTIKLSNGIEIPQIGLGTWQINDREVLRNLMRVAYETGYRLFDTAAAYGNEISIGRNILDLELKRDELFISDKVWNSSRGHDAVVDACKKSLKKLKMEYLDMYLIHWPASPKLYTQWHDVNADTWRGMETLYREGLAKAIGVCNFKIPHLEKLKRTAKILPMLNQVECHPGMPQHELISYCQINGIAVEASSPLGNGQILQNSELEKIAVHRNKTVAQICLKWAVQRQVVVIPKTANIDRLAENVDIYNFELTQEEMNYIDAIPYCGGIGIDSDEVIQFG